MLFSYLCVFVPLGAKRLLLVLIFYYSLYSMSKTYKWYKIADTIEEIIFSSDGLVELEVSGKKICIALKNKTLFACTAKCPHAGGNMSHGYVDALGNIVCPLHRYKFSLANGRNTSGEGYFLKNYPIEIRVNGIFVGFEETSMFSWLK
jgi:nitrite reductase/ring-hydroxylating ferredoxin subunit